HLTDDQGFRLECETWPKLHEIGSAGAYFTKAEMRGLIDAAAERGIRIVPEFGLPGHSIAWQVAYPELAAANPPPSRVGELEGYFSPGIDPVEDGTYTFIDRFVEEMAALFPDPYFHIGGDEVNGRAWHENPDIAAFMAEKGFKRSADLQAHFTTRFAKIVAAHGKVAVGWEEILHGNIADEVIIHLWDKGTYAPELARHPVLTSWNYYLDHQQPSDWLYGKDPLDFKLKDGSSNAPLNVLGAEVTNWSETINGETLDMRTWPRTFAIAERLWSQRDFADGEGHDDLRARMQARSLDLEAAGLMHRARSAEFFADQFEDEAVSALVAEFAELLQPAAYPFFRRRRAILERTLPKLFPLRHEDRYSNVDRLVDNLIPESEIAWAF
ncbi:MAG: family 20 glycosylhydrolase, partial [Flavobacteriales bacterium]|nr:family 20 glycosylhydrolase [Flavobacteriales bacterium]